MKKLVNEAFVLGIVVIAILITGCGQPEPLSVKMSRVIAAENMQLKDDLRKSDWEIENLKELHREQVEKLEEIITEYQGKIKILEEKSRQNIRQQAKDILDVVLEQNAELRKEIEALKVDNEKLKKELQELKKTISPD